MSIKDPKSVLLIGPGFIGRHVLDLLVTEAYKVTAIGIRSQESANAVEQAGASAVIGNIDDTDFVATHVYQHSIIIHAASADHEPSVQGVLAGIKRRASESLSVLYIHTSGTSLTDDNAKGEFKSDQIFHDSTRKDIDSVPDEAPHRNIDTAILAVQEELRESAKIAIMVPPLIYGYNPAHGRLSIQIPTLTRFALKHGYAAHMGKGLAVESNIHVADLARGFMVLLHHMEGTPTASLLGNPYWLCECTGDKEPSWKDVATLIGQSLHAAGRIKDAEPQVMPPELYGDAFEDATGGIIGLNSRSRAHRLRELGWQPREKDWKSSFVEDELPVLLKEDCSAWRGYMAHLKSK